MNKLHFCCGKNKFEGWENYDLDIDITKPLPFEDGYADFIYVEHGLEHVDYKQGYDFIKECYRIVKKGGVVRIAIPCIDKLFSRADEKYNISRHRRKSWRKKYGDDFSKENIINDIMFNHGHKMAYTLDMLVVIMDSIGFIATEQDIGQSNFSELEGLDGKGRGKWFHAFYCQTGIAEGIK